MRNTCVATESGSKKWLLVITLGFCLVMLGCKPATDLANHDPFESFNRVVFNFNDALDQTVLRPTALAYKQTIPASIRANVDNFLKWLNSPTIIANDIIQGDLEQAQNSSARLLMNATSIGLIDAAADFGMDHRSEDFGQTLGVYGLSGGPYLVLPILGPSNIRDVIGRVVDHFINPLSYIGTLNNQLPYTVSRGLLSAVNFRSENFDQIDDLGSNSLDTYARVRTIYGQQRRAAIGNGKIPINISTQDASDAFEEHVIVPPPLKKTPSTKIAIKKKQAKR